MSELLGSRPGAEPVFAHSPKFLALGEIGLDEPLGQLAADLNNQFAHQETDPERQLTAWEAPETLGLLCEPR
jgi:Tat protein secretion system quality control protein TatD with DNase activity